MRKVYGIYFVVIACLFGHNAFPQSITIDVGTEYQYIRGFGGMNMPSWIADLTTEQVNTAFGNHDGQMGLSILRIKVPTKTSGFAKEVPTALAAYNLGATVFATPWSPPSDFKSVSSTTGGYLLEAYYDDFADYLLQFVDYMKGRGVPLYAVSVQNEPDIEVDYESCDWTPDQMVQFVQQEGPKFDSIKLIVAESYHFDQAQTDPILNDSIAESYVDVIGGHIYGGGLADYPLARAKGKEVWMTEHLDTDTTWTAVLATGEEIHNCMQANFNAYVWWYVRRFYGLLNEKGQISKRGYVMSQFSKFIRPGYTRIGATCSGADDVLVTAYKKDTSLVIVTVNQNSTPLTLNLNIPNSTFNRLTQYTTSASKNLSNDQTINLNDGVFAITLDANSISTFIALNDTNQTKIHMQQSSRMNVYPNPANDYIFINNSTGKRWLLFDNMGGLVKKGEVDKTYKIDISHLSQGGYFIQISNDNQSYYSKFIKL